MSRGLLRGTPDHVPRGRRAYTSRGGHAMPRIPHAVRTLVVMLALTGLPSISQAADCAGLPTAEQLRVFLGQAATGAGIGPALGPGTGVGGLFGGQRMWAAVVNRDGRLC